MTFEELYEAAKQEWEVLKDMLTPEEMSRLEGAISPADATMCIYGKATGSCFSSRAEYLIKECAPVYLTSRTDLINVSTVPILRFSEEFYGRHFSPIELLIMEKDGVEHFKDISGLNIYNIEDIEDENEPF